MPIIQRSLSEIEKLLLLNKRTSNRGLSTTRNSVGRTSFDFRKGEAKKSKKGWKLSHPFVQYKVLSLLLILIVVINATNIVVFCVFQVIITEVVISQVVIIEIVTRWVVIR